MRGLLQRAPGSPGGAPAVEGGGLNPAARREVRPGSAPECVGSVLDAAAQISLPPLPGHPFPVSSCPGCVDQSQNAILARHRRWVSPASGPQVGTSEHLSSSLPFPPPPRRATHRCRPVLQSRPTPFPAASASLWAHCALLGSPPSCLASHLAPLSLVSPLRALHSRSLPLPLMPGNSCLSLGQHLLSARCSHLQPPPSVI